MQGIEWRWRVGRLLVLTAMTIALGAAGAGTALAQGNGQDERGQVAVPEDRAEGLVVQILLPEVAVSAAPGVELTRVPPIPTADLRSSLEPSDVREKGLQEALDPGQQIPSHGVSTAFYPKRYRTISLNRAPDPRRIPRTDLRRSLEPSRIRSHRLGRP